MATYLVLSNWTEQGWRNLKDRPKRVQRNRERERRYGVYVTSAYFMNGPYNVVGIVEAPNEAALTTAMLETAVEGNVRRTVVRAYTWEEYREYLGVPSVGELSTDERAAHDLPTYVMFSRWTEQGWRNLKDRPKRLAQNQAHSRRSGIQRKAQYFLNGPVDVVTILGAPSEEVLTAALLRTSIEGNVDRTIVRAYTWEEYARFLGTAMAGRPAPAE
jgi:uncharacterized protein with GYD domain